MKNKHRVLTLFLAIVMMLTYVPASSFAEDSGKLHINDIGWIENCDGEDIFEGCSNLNSCIDFEVDDPVFVVWVVDIKAKNKTTDKLSFLLQKKGKNGYKNILSDKFSLSKSNRYWTFIYNNLASDKLTKGHYRLKIIPKKKSGAFYKAKCNVYIYDSIKPVSPSKLKKKYSLSPGQSAIIAKSEGSAQLYLKHETVGDYTGIAYDPIENAWYVYANNNISSNASEKIIASFANGKKRATNIIINPLRWWNYSLYEGQSFNEYYYRWNGKKWGKWNLKNITWYSTNGYIASVSRNGKVKAKNIGTCYIVGKYKGKTAKCKVTVYASKPRKGMTKKQVLNSKWGSPTRKNDYGSGQVQWVYEWNSGETDYVYFRNGRVTNIQRYNY